MRYGIALTMFLLLGACSSEEPAPSPTEQPERSASARPPMAPPAPAAAAKPRLVEEKSDLLEFTYGWPAEAAAIPKLNQRLEADLRNERKEAAAIAREDKAARGDDASFNGHSFTQVWGSFGQTPRLLSLVSEMSTFTGGAHRNSVYQALLWERQGGFALAPKHLFVDAKAAFAAMNPVYCKELDRQRAEKRDGADMSEAAEWMTDCKPIGEQVITPVDADKDGRFELFRVLLEPYNAGPYAEGTYEVDVPVTAEIRKLLKPEYAPSF